MVMSKYRRTQNIYLQSEVGKVLDDLGGQSESAEGVGLRVGLREAEE